MPSKPELLNTTSIVLLNLAPAQPREFIHIIEKYVKRGDLEEAIGLCSWYCFHSPAPLTSLQRKRYVLKRLWYLIEELFDNRLEAQITDQIRYRCSIREADAKKQDTVQLELREDMHRSHRVSKLLGQCEALVLMMHEKEELLTPEGLQVLSDKLTQSQDGA